MNMSEKIIAYKAMDKNMQCRGKQYEVGKTYHEDEADCRNAGMHACENPLDVLHYYPLRDSPRFFEVECGGNVDKSKEDSKLACTELAVKGEVNFAGLVKATVNAVFNRVKGKEPFPAAITARRVPVAITARRVPAAIPARRVPAAVAARRVPVAIPARRVPAAVAARRVPVAIPARRQPLGLIAEQKQMEKTMSQSQTARTVRHGAFWAAILC